MNLKDPQEKLKPKQDAESMADEHIYHHASLKGCQLAYVGVSLYSIIQWSDKRYGFRHFITTIFPKTLARSTALGVLFANMFAYYITNYSTGTQYLRSLLLKRSDLQDNLDDYTVAGWAFGIMWTMTSARYNFFNCMITGGFVACSGLCLNEFGLKSLGLDLSIPNIKTWLY